MHALLRSSLEKKRVTCIDVLHSEITIAKKGKKSWLFIEGFTPLVPYTVGLFISNKTFVKTLLEQQKIQIPIGKAFGVKELHFATEYFETLHKPVILRQENSQIAVKAKRNIHNLEQFKRDFRELSQYGESVLVEEQVYGQRYSVFIHTDGWLQILETKTLEVSGPIVSTSAHERQFTSKKIAYDVTSYKYKDILPVSKRLLTIFPSLLACSFDCVVNEKKEVIVTEMYHSVSRHYPYEAKKGRQKQSVVDLITTSILSV